jgi:uncharacterized protein YwqG
MEPSCHSQQPKTVSVIAKHKSRLPPVVKQHQRTAWTPVIETRKGKPIDSKIGGVPYLLPNEEWPLCRSCHEPLTFFLQLNSTQLKKPIFGQGLLQVFYCTNEDSFQPFDQSHFLRLLRGTESPLNPSDERENPTPLNPSDERKDMWETKPLRRKGGYGGTKSPHPTENVIVDWKQTDDYPSNIELTEMGIDLSDFEDQMLCATNFPLHGDKLSGWPAWVQGVEYPICPECKQQMTMIFQLDSNYGLDYMFGDTGCAHITQCSNHPNSLAMGWTSC